MRNHTPSSHRPPPFAARRRAVQLSLCLFAVALGSAAFAKKGGEPTLPRAIQVEGKTLALTGEAVQRKLIFDVYAIGLYLEQPAATPDEVVSSDQVKRVRIRMLRDARREQVVKALQEGFANGNQESTAALAPKLSQLLSAIRDVKKGDALTITYVPGQGTTLESGTGSGLRVPGKDFADALLKVWLGKDPGTKKLQRDLLGQG